MHLTFFKQFFFKSNERMSCSGLKLYNIFNTFNFNSIKVNRRNCKDVLLHNIYLSVINLFNNTITILVQIGILTQTNIFIQAIETTLQQVSLYTSWRQFPSCFGIWWKFYVAHSRLLVQCYVVSIYANNRLLSCAVLMNIMYKSEFFVNNVIIFYEPTAHHNIYIEKLKKASGQVDGFMRERIYPLIMTILKPKH